MVHWTPSVRQLEIVQLIARHGNLTKVARLLGLTQPAISHSLRDLEARLGYKLFTRDVDGLRPTRHAVALLPQIVDVLQALEALAGDMQQPAIAAVAELRVAALNSVAVTFLPRALGAFRADHPGVVVSVHAASTREVTAMVRSGHVDFGSVYACSGAVSPHTAPLLETEVACFAEPSPVPGGAGLPLSLGEMGPRSVIMPAQETAIGERIRSAIGARMFADLSLLEVNTAASALGFVREGLGVALLDPLLATHSASAGLSARSIAPSIVLRMDLLHQPLRSDVADRFIPYLHAAAITTAAHLRDASIHARAC